MNTNPSLNKIHIDKSRNTVNDALSHTNKVVNNINVLSHNKKEEEKQSLTYQHTNNDEQQTKKPR